VKKCKNLKNETEIIENIKEAILNLNEKKGVSLSLIPLLFHFLGRTGHFVADFFFRPTLSQWLKIGFSFLIIFSNFQNAKNKESINLIKPKIGNVLACREARKCFGDWVKAL